MKHHPTQIKAWHDYEDHSTLEESNALAEKHYYPIPHCEYKGRKIRAALWSIIQENREYRRILPDFNLYSNDGALYWSMMNSRTTWRTLRLTSDERSWVIDGIFWPIADYPMFIYTIAKIDDTY